MAPALLLLTGFTVAMYLREPVMGIYFGVSVAIFLTVTVAMSLKYVAPPMCFQTTPTLTWGARSTTP